MTPATLDLELSRSLLLEIMMRRLEPLRAPSSPFSVAVFLIASRDGVPLNISTTTTSSGGTRWLNGPGFLQSERAVDRTPVPMAQKFPVAGAWPNTSKKSLGRIPSRGPVQQSIFGEKPIGIIFFYTFFCTFFFGKYVIFSFPDFFYSLLLNICYRQSFN